VILLYHSLSLWQILVGTDLREQAKIAEDQSRSSGSRGIVIDIDCMALLIDKIVQVLSTMEKFLDILVLIIVWNGVAICSLNAYIIVLFS